MLVSGAFLGATLAGVSAQFEHRPQHDRIRAGTAHGQLSRRITYVGAVEAEAHTLAHIHRFGGAGIRARGAHGGTKHCVP